MCGNCKEIQRGGFGGTILAFVPKKLQEEYIEKMESVFGENACVELSIRPIGTTDVEIQG